MFNVLLDELPQEWEGYPIDTSFRTGIQIMQCLQDEEFEQDERIMCALCLLFPDVNKRPDIIKAQETLEWYLTEFNHDNHKKKNGTAKAFDFDTDQWRIYSAFLKQYRIDLNTVDMHWFVFMGLLSNLDECAFTRVIDVRTKKINPKDSKEVKKAIAEAKEVYRLGEIKQKELTTEEKERDKAALEQFNRLRNKK